MNCWNELFILCKNGVININYEIQKIIAIEILKLMKKNIENQKEKKKEKILRIFSMKKYIKD